MSSIINANKRSSSHEVSHVNVKENEQMKNWIILDSVSTMNLFSNPVMVKNIKEVGEKMYLVTNIRFKINNQKS